MLGEFGPRACKILAAILATNAPAASVTGTATYRERMALPPGAVFEASIEDVSRADAPSTVIGHISFVPTGQVPIAFEIPYQEGRVHPAHRYGVRATIRHDGQLQFTTTQFYPVLTQGAGKRVDVLMQRVTAPAKPDRSLTNTYWKLTELDGKAVKVMPRQREPHMILQTEENRLAGSGGCNRMMGSYTLDGPSLSFGKVASTMMACADSMDQETAFFGALERSRAWTVQGDALQLMDSDGAVLARFVAVDLR